MLLLKKVHLLNVERFVVQSLSLSSQTQAHRQQRENISAQPAYFVDYQKSTSTRV